MKPRQNMTLKPSLFRVLFISTLAVSTGGNPALAQDQPTGDSDRGKTYFQTSCAICHTTSLGPGNTVIVKQGPSLVGVLGGAPVPAWVSTTRRRWWTQALCGMPPH
jgi:mono/diheme cytochrome c family protein